MDIAEAAPPAAGDDDLLPGRDQVREELAVRLVEHPGAGRNRDDEIVAGLPMPLRPEAASAGLGPEVVREPKVPQRREAGVHAQHDGAASTAVAAVRAALRDVRLAPKRGRAVAAIASPDPDRYAVKKHRGRLSHAPRPWPAAGVRSRPAG